MSSDPVPSSPRQRSSTLKPPKKRKRELNLVLHPHAQPYNCTPIQSHPNSCNALPAPTLTQPSNTRPPYWPTCAFYYIYCRDIAVFLVRLTIHQLHNVPLVHGEFGVRWKVKGVTSPSGGGILGKVKGRSKVKNKVNSDNPGNVTPVDDGEGKEKQDRIETTMTRESGSDNASLLDGASASVSDTHSITNSSSTHSHSYDHGHSVNGSAQGHTTTTTRIQTLPIPSGGHICQQSYYRTTFPTFHDTKSLHPRPLLHTTLTDTRTTPLLRTIFLLTGYHKDRPSPQRRPNLIHRRNLLILTPMIHIQIATATATTATTMDILMLTPTPTAKPQASPKLPLKRATPLPKAIHQFVKLKDHSIIWEQTLDFVVQMSVARESSELGDCLARGIQMLLEIHVYGAVYLNLAQYVNAGVVTRRYLLRESKTNATLKLTIHLEHTAGELCYVAPPLPKGEILSGVANLLESSDVYRTRPRALDLYKDSLSHSSSEEDVRGPGPGAPSASVSGHADCDIDHVQTSSTNTGEVKAGRSDEDRSILPSCLLSIDPRGTEKLIEALFNPVPVTQLGKLNPFTYLVEVDGEGADADADQASYGGADGLGMAEHQGNLGRGGCTKGGRREWRSERLPFYPIAALRRRSLPNEQPLRSIGSKAGLRVDDALGGTGVSTGIDVYINTAGGGDRERAWWQKTWKRPLWNAIVTVFAAIRTVSDGLFDVQHKKYHNSCCGQLDLYSPSVVLSEFIVRPSVVKYSVHFAVPCYIIIWDKGSMDASPIDYHLVQPIVKSAALSLVNVQTYSF
ncbi:hypothetical protein BU15DRAFT_62252 [Melanogaster broomeanus]|nr:hypothetical protein BU15DRAFT_62252 [Melanogaster broomeanus]